MKIDMKVLFVLGIIMGLGIWTGVSGVQAENLLLTQEDTTIYVIADQNPEFKGKLNEWLSQNVNYPKEAQDASIEGRVYVSFVVEKDGSITNVSIARSVHPLVDAEAVRVYSSMPKWAPALREGKAVRFSQTFPLTFKLQDPPPTEEEQQPEEQFTYQMYLDNLLKEKEMLEKGEGQLSPEEQAQRVAQFKTQFGSDQEVFNQMLNQAFLMKGEVENTAKEQAKKLKLKKAELKKLGEIYVGEVDGKIQLIRKMGENDFIRSFVANELNFRRLEMQKVLNIQDLLGDRFELYFKHYVLGEE